MKKFVSNFRNYLIEAAVSKKTVRDETLFFFTESQFQDLDQYCKSNFNFTLVGSPFVENLASEPELQQVAEAEDDDDWAWTDSDDSSDEKVISLQKKKFQKAKDTRPQWRDYLGGREVTAMTPSDYEEEGWVIKVPKKVLDSIDSIMKKTAEASEVYTSGIYSDAKQWYHILNDLCDYNKGIPLSREDEGLFAMFLAVFSPMTAFQTNFREAVLAYKALKIDIEQGHVQELYEYVQEGVLHGNTEAVLFREKYPKLSTAHYWAEIALFGGAKWKNYCEVVKRYIEMDGLPLEEASRLLQKDLNWIKTSKIHKLGLSKREFIGRTKIANFALNIVDPNISQKDEDYVLNVTIDTWMTRAFYPGIGISEKILGDPHSYYYLVSHVVEKARQYNLQPHEFQAIVWVHLLKEDKANVAATASEMSNLFSGLVKEEMEQIMALAKEKPDDTGFASLKNSAEMLMSKFNTLEDFVNVRTIVGLPSNRGD